LEKYEKRFRVLTEHANDLIGIVNKEFILEYINESALHRILGYKGAGIIGKNVLSFIDPKDRTLILNALTQGFKQGEEEIEIQVKRKDGQPIWLEMKGRTFLDEEGEIKGIVIARDISKRKEFEKKLQESEEMFRTITEQSLMGIAIFQNNHIVYMNNAFAKITETLPGDLITIVGKETFQFIKETLNEKSESKTISIPPTTFQIITKSKKVKWLESYSRSITYQGKPAIFITVIDISERKKAEEKYNLFKKQLEEKNRLAAIGQLAAGIAHELNTPLANINLSSDYILNLLKEINSSVKQAEVEKEIHDIKKQIKYCSQIVQDLLQFSHGMKLQIQKFNLSNLIEEVLNSSSLKDQIQQNQIQIFTKLDESIELIGDRLLISQVLKNIIQNAIDSLKDPQERPKIQIFIRESQSNIVFIVKDNGKGIPSDKLPRIFEPFFTTKPVGKGTGLGLSICRGIVEKHGGIIEVKSTVNLGTEVIINLPKNFFKEEFPY